MEQWLRADRPLGDPHDRFMDHKRLEMLIQARHPVVEQHGSLCEGACAPAGILRGARGVWTGEIPAEFGSGKPEKGSSG